MQGVCVLLDNLTQPPDEGVGLTAHRLIKDFIKIERGFIDHFRKSRVSSYSSNFTLHPKSISIPLRCLFDFMAPQCQGVDAKEFHQSRRN